MIGTGCWREVGDAIAASVPVVVLDAGRLHQLARFDLVADERRTRAHVAVVGAGPLLIDFAGHALPRRRAR